MEYPDGNGRPRIFGPTNPVNRVISGEGCGFTVAARTKSQVGGNVIRHTWPVDQRVGVALRIGATGFSDGSPVRWHYREPRNGCQLEVAIPVCLGTDADWLWGSASGL